MLLVQGLGRGGVEERTHPRAWGRGEGNPCVWAGCERRAWSPPLGCGRRRRGRSTAARSQG